MRCCCRTGPRAEDPSEHGRSLREKADPDVGIHPSEERVLHRGSQGFPGEALTSNFRILPQNRGEHIKITATEAGSITFYDGSRTHERRRNPRGIFVSLCPSPDRPRARSVPCPPTGSHPVTTTVNVRTFVGTTGPPDPPGHPIRGTPSTGPPKPPFRSDRDGLPVRAGTWPAQAPLRSARGRYSSAPFPVSLSAAPPPATAPPVPPRARRYAPLPAAVLACRSEGV
ncbi:MAG: hypothetical protein QG608_3376 [Actinomycetota bacterium]|nr:hypothetical protein [Actinomycetota bacterium]